VSGGQPAGAWFGVTASCISAWAPVQGDAVVRNARAASAHCSSPVRRCCDASVWAAMSAGICSTTGTNARTSTAVTHVPERSRRAGRTTAHDQATPHRPAAPYGLAAAHRPRRPLTGELPPGATTTPRRPRRPCGRSLRRGVSVERIHGLDEQPPTWHMSDLQICDVPPAGHTKHPRQYLACGNGLRSRLKTATNSRRSRCGQPTAPWFQVRPGGPCR
jgi:hypothetical protein